MSSPVLDQFNPDGRLPLYQRIRDIMASRIASGEWRPGTPIPPEQKIAAEFGVAVGTVRNAISSLVDKGLMERQQGIGTFVRCADFTNSIFRFFQLYHEDGTPVLPEGRVLERRAEKADPQLASRLAIEPGQSVYYIHRLRSIGAEPLLVEEIWLPYDEFSALAALPDDEWDMLLYRMYERHCFRTVAKVADDLSFGRATDEESKYLKLPRASSVLIIERGAYGFEGRPIEWRRAVGDANLFQFSVEMN